MSLDVSDLQRSTLQRKDRSELTTIATALGGKPGSRARKDDLVTMILDLAGGGSAGGEGGNGNGRGSEQGGADRATGAASEAGEAGQERSGGETADTGADRASAASGEESGAGDRSPGGDSDEGGERGDSAGAGRGRDRSQGGPDRGSDVRRGSDQRSGADRGGRDRDRSDQGSGDQATSGDQGSGDQAKGGDQGKSDQGKGDQGKGDQNRGGDQGKGGDRSGGKGGDGGSDQPEPGNRRRRRRGRDRERNEDNWSGEPVAVEGFLDLRDEGYGFLRVKGYLPSKDDAYVSVKQVRQFGLRKGDHVTGASRPAGRNEKNPALLRIDTVNGGDAEQAKQRPRFEDLTPLFPDEKLIQEMPDDPTNMTARIIDLISPIGKGQRGLIVSPPKAGKTTIMKSIARSIETNHPEVHVMVLLVDERPEEVTDMRRWLLHGEVIASTFDRPSDEHTHVAEMTIERAKRMVEQGKDVCIILDGITRLARAYNLAAPATGRIMSGGVDSGALYPPKRFFGAARNVEEGGSLTILATALVETGSRMDEVIFEEFKGTGNMELRLDRRTAERRIYPAIDVDASSTRHEELLFERKQLQQVWKLRRVLSGLASDGDGGGAAGLELLIDRLKTFRNNDEFLAEVARGPSMGG